MDDILLVDEQNNPVGTGEKTDVHRRGILHRAFSILVYNSRRDILLQKRALLKYHCPGLWTNACCSHPKPGEHLLISAKTRLKEEMGIDSPVLEMGVEFIYKIKLGDLTEYEYDHVLYSKFDGDPLPNPKEASDWKWMSFSDLRNGMKINPESYTPWFRLIISQGDSNVEGIHVQGLERYVVTKLETYE